MVMQKRMWFNLAGGFAAVLFLMILVAYVGYSVMSNVIERYNQGNHVSLMINSILTAHQQEKNFIIHRDKKYVELMESALADLNKEAALARIAFKNQNNGKYLDTIVLSTDTYKTAFDAYVTRSEALMAAEAEMEGSAQKLIEIAQTLEEKFDDQLIQVRSKSNSKVMNKLGIVRDADLIIEWTLECQLNEKQYIVTKKDEHVQNIDDHIHDIIEMADDMGGRFSEKDNKDLVAKLIEAAEIYQAGFKQYVMLPWKGSELDMMEAARDLIAISRSIRGKQHIELSDVQLEANAYIENHLMMADMTHEVVNSILLCLQKGRNFVLFGSDQDSTDVKKYLRDIIDFTKRIERKLQDVESLNQINHIRDLVLTYKGAFERCVALKELHEKDIEIFKAAADETNEAFEQIHRNQILLIEQQIALGGRVLFICSALGLLFGVILAFLIIKQTTKANNLLRKAKEEAELANQAKSDFLALMSHEIRTPLNAVTGLTNVVLKSELQAEQRDYLNKVRLASNNLLEVINDILDFSKVEAGRLELNNTPFQLDQVLDQLADIFSNRVKEKDLELIVIVPAEVPKQLIGDGGRLTQVLTNLVENAVKFTDGGEIVIRAEFHEQAEEHPEQTTLEFSVSDTGAGIDSKVLPTLFEPFTQAEGYLGREHEGAGLGLAICSRLVELMGGRIWAESIPGQGSTFHFTVVFGVLEQERPRFTLPQELIGLKTLVVDDSGSARQVLGDLLNSFSFQVSAVDSGPKAIEALCDIPANEAYQLVLLDWKMPGMDGLETAKRIRNDINLSKLPIIILVTSYGREFVAQHVDTDMVDSMLMKPVKASGLFNTIMDLFGHGDSSLPSGERQRNEFSNRYVGRRLLVVEDSELNRDVAEAILTDVGLIVEVAENGKLAVEKVTKAPRGYYDAVLMDIQMPVMDGYEATKQIREFEEQHNLTVKQPPRKVPIIALTAHALKGEREKCLEVGMVDYLSKPIDEKELERVLEKWIPSEFMDRVELERMGTGETVDDETVLDVTGALRRLGGRKSMYHKALEHFTHESANAYVAIEQHLELGDRETASRMTHTVKGDAATIGALVLQKAALELENKITNNQADLQEELLRFKMALEQTLDAVEKYNQGTIG